jgi:hypothetical protein
MRVILLLFFSLIGIFANAQTLTAKDLLTLWDCTLDSCFNTYVMKKGYTHQSQLTRKAENNPDRYYEPGADKCSENIVQNQKSSVAYSTIRKDRYEELMRDFTSLGFTDFKEENSILKSRSKQYPEYVVMVNEDNMRDTCKARRARYTFYINKEHLVDAKELVALASCPDYNCFVWSLGRNGYTSDLAQLGKQITETDMMSWSFSRYGNCNTCMAKYPYPAIKYLNILEPGNETHLSARTTLSYTPDSIRLNTFNTPRFNDLKKGLAVLGFIENATINGTKGYFMKSTSYPNLTIMVTTTEDIVKKGCNYTITIEKGK